MMLGLATSLEAGTLTLSATPVLVTVEDRGEVVAAALRTPPHNLLITRASDDAIAALVVALREQGVALPGVMGPAEDAERFAIAWGGERERFMQQLLYACDQVAALRPARGALRAADEGDQATLHRFTSGFQDAIREPIDERRIRATVERHLSAGTLFVWDDGEIVSMTMVQGATARGIRISGVYTPPELRNRGYATSCVAEVTRRMLAEGRHFCVLYTDASNPTSNAIYTRIGYKPICESAIWRFSSS